MRQMVTHINEKIVCSNSYTKDENERKIIKWTGLKN